MARRSRKKNNKKNLVIVAVTAVSVVFLMMVMQYFHSNRAADQVNSDFSVATYRQDGSRFASSGNEYRLVGTVENIETVGNSRLISISIEGQDNERLPLLVPDSARLGINLTRQKTYVFKVSCRTGMDGEGKQVKGILIVNDVTTKS